MDKEISASAGAEILDLLDRQEFVDRMLTIAKTLSDNKKNACYAVNGDWGVGKSFVLDMFEEQAQLVGREGEELPRFLIFRYNCWEYDYYEEPLVAIVASILDQIDNKVDLLRADIKTRIVAALKVIGKGLAKRAVQLIEEKACIDIEEAFEAIKEGGEAAEKKVEESHEYDQYFDFKRNLKKLQETIGSLAEEQTVIFVVDELDRCLPEYTIKVLERLHHLFDGVNNVQVILSIDFGQLEHIVRQIYGEGTDAKRYLRKFIQFGMKLNAGNLNDCFNEKFKEYTQHFETKSPTTSDRDVNEFRACVFDSMDMRSRISVINRCSLIHTALSDNSIHDTSYMCLEILLVILNDCGLIADHTPPVFSISSVFNQTVFEREIPIGIKNLSEKYSSNQISKNNPQKFFDSRYNSLTEQHENYVNTSCLFGKLLFVYRVILGFQNDCPVYSRDGASLSEYMEYGVKFWKLLQVIQ